VQSIDLRLQSNVCSRLELQVTLVVVELALEGALDVMRPRVVALD
jgi:hypothetical protein